MAGPPGAAQRRCEAGALRFARYATAPNRLGYCGPSDDLALVEQAVALARSREPPEPGSGPTKGPERTDLVSGLRSSAVEFDGAWPYLELIAGANGIRDPLDDRVVSAYWLGGPLLHGVDAFSAGVHVEQRFRAGAGRSWGRVSAALAAGVAPSHAFHVLVVGPWIGMLRAGRVDAPLQVLDRCRIRCGHVRSIEGDVALVSTDRVDFDHGRLRLRSDPSTLEPVSLGEPSQQLCGPVSVGDTVAIHWDRVCEVLTPYAARSRARTEGAAIEQANRALAIPRSPQLG